MIFSFTKAKNLDLCLEKGYAKHDNHGPPEHDALSVCFFQEYGAGNQGQRGKQLVGRAEQRPDARVTCPG